VQVVTPGSALDVPWWVPIDAHRVAMLTGATIEELRTSLDPLPPSAPAVVFCPAPPLGAVAECVQEILDRLERAAVDLFPAWLPSAVDLTSSDATEAAVRDAARSLAASTEDFGPFVAELALRAFRGEMGGEWAISAEQRTEGLARVIARSLDRSCTALILETPVRCSRQEEGVLAGASRWLAHQGDLTVWLVGTPLSTVDWLTSHSVTGALLAVVPQADTVQAAPIQLGPAGKPKPGIESFLGHALAARNWAGSHTWNTSLTLGALGPIVQPDIQWTAERVVVEVDGPEHRSVAKYAADRRRDGMLLLKGYLVMRFTNEQVRSDLPYVLHTIRELLLMRRNP
jgi:hypothetical protein